MVSTYIYTFINDLLKKHGSSVITWQKLLGIFQLNYVIDTMVISIIKQYLIHPNGFPFLMWHTPMNMTLQLQGFKW